MGRLQVGCVQPGHAIDHALPFHAGWGWDNENRGLDARPDKVKLALDKPAYRAGDKLESDADPAASGKGLVMVESDRMLFVQSLDVKPGTVVEIVHRTGSGTISTSPPWYCAVVVPLSKITPARAVGESFRRADGSPSQRRVGEASTRCHRKLSLNNRCR